jgi:dihydroxyacetone kinase-like predicted kinase
MPPDREALCAVLAAAADELERRREELNACNVFPVADGDTGDNMVLTVRAALRAVGVPGGSGPAPSEAEASAAPAAVARAALLGARGNSGVILSQMLRGAASGSGSGLPALGAAAAAMRGATAAAYASVPQPVEGTMLTVVRAMAERLEQRVASGAPGPHDGLEGLAAALEEALDAGREALAEGPEQLPVLRDAGVVDAGALGVTALLAGALEGLRRLAGSTLAEPGRSRAGSAARAGLGRHAAAAGRFGHCVNFTVEGHALELDRLRSGLEPLGDSVLVVGDARLVRVHLHTDDARAAVARGAQEGRVSRIDVSDMRRQVEDRARALGP